MPGMQPQNLTDNRMKKIIVSKRIVVILLLLVALPESGFLSRIASNAAVAVKKRRYRDRGILMVSDINKSL